MEWTRGPIIGWGSSAAVSLATTASGELLAVKSTDLSCSAMLQREQKILSQLSSPHIVKYLGYDIKYESHKRGATYNILMEYVPGGTLGSISLEESMIRLYTNQILQGLNYLHSHHNLVHCDIKGRNILLGTHGIKIADFGCAKFLENGAASKSNFSGTPVFMAPEVACGQEQGFPVDIWSLGCTVIEMASGSNPWPELDDPVSALHKIGYSGEVPQFPKQLSDDGKDFLSKCLERDPKHRWTAKQLLEHPFVAVDQLGSYTYHDECFIVRNSPTGVLDLRFWDSMQVSEASHHPIHFSTSPAAAAAERIRGLLASTTTPGLPGWTDQQTWFTVRANHTAEETQEFSNNDNNNANNNNNNNSDGSPSIHTQVFDFSISHQEEELPGPTSIDHFFDFAAETVISTRTDNGTHPVLSSQLMDVSVSCTSINFEKQVNKTIFPFTLNFVQFFEEYFFTDSVHFRFLLLVFSLQSMFTS